MQLREMVHVLEYNSLPCPLGHAILSSHRNTQMDIEGCWGTQIEGFRVKKNFCFIFPNFVYDVTT